MAFEINGHVSAEGRLFAHDPLYPDQEKNNASIALEPEFYHAWDVDYSLIFIPFLRIDNSDSERTHFDIRELNILLLGNPWELRIGIGKVFWGVTEFVHLVDIINQTDLVEDIEGEDKLGQPMVHLSPLQQIGAYLISSYCRIFASAPFRDVMAGCVLKMLLILTILFMKVVQKKIMSILPFVTVKFLISAISVCTILKALAGTPYSPLLLTRTARPCFSPIISK